MNGSTAEGESGGGGGGGVGNGCRAWVSPLRLLRGAGCGVKGRDGGGGGGGGEGRGGGPGRTRPRPPEGGGGGITGGSVGGGRGKMGDWQETPHATATHVPAAAYFSVAISTAFTPVTVVSTAANNNTATAAGQAFSESPLLSFLFFAKVIAICLTGAV